MWFLSAVLNSSACTLSDNIHSNWVLKSKKKHYQLISDFVYANSQWQSSYSICIGSQLCTCLQVWAALIATVFFFFNSMCTSGFITVTHIPPIQVKVYAGCTVSLRGHRLQSGVVLDNVTVWYRILFIHMTQPQVREDNLYSLIYSRGWGRSTISNRLTYWKPALWPKGLGRCLISVPFNKEFKIPDGRLFRDSGPI